MRRQVKIGLGIFLCLLLILSWIALRMRPETEQGVKNYTLKVISRQQKERVYHASTEETYLRGAMDELAETQDFDYDGEKGGPGFMVLTLNGERAVYRKDHAYWALYDNDEYASKGVDRLPVAEDHTYTFRYKEASK